MSGPVLDTFQILTHLIILITNEVVQYPQVTDKATQGQNGEETYPTVSNTFRRESVALCECPSGLRKTNLRGDEVDVFPS